MLLGTENLCESKNNHTENSSENSNVDLSRLSLTSEKYKQFFGEAKINSNKETDNTVTSNNSFVAFDGIYINIAAKNHGKCCPCTIFRPGAVCARLGRFIKNNRYACGCICGKCYRCACRF